MFGKGTIHADFGVAPEGAHDAQTALEAAGFTVTMDGCADSKKDEETIDALRRRERELSARIARLQADEERLTARAAGDE